MKPRDVAALAFLYWIYLGAPGLTPRAARAARAPRGAPAGVLTFGELRTLAADAGFPDPDLAAAIALAESSGNPLAHNVSSREDSRGLWQVNVRAHREWTATDLYDPRVNVRAALAVSKKGADWTPWTTYVNRSYRRHLPRPTSIA